MMRFKGLLLAGAAIPTLAFGPATFAQTLDNKDLPQLLAQLDAGKGGDNDRGKGDGNKGDGNRGQRPDRPDRGGGDPRQGQGPRGGGDRPEPKQERQQQQQPAREQRPEPRQEQRQERPQERIQNRVKEQQQERQDRQEQRQQQQRDKVRDVLPKDMQQRLDKKERNEQQERDNRQQRPDAQKQQDQRPAQPNDNRQPNQDRKDDRTGRPDARPDGRPDAARPDARPNRQQDSRPQDSRPDRRPDDRDQRDGRDRRDDRQDSRQENRQDNRQDRGDDRRDSRRDDRRDDRRERARNLDELRNERRESREGNRTIIREGDRTIVREGNTTIIRRDEGSRFRRFGGDGREQRMGNETRFFSRGPGGREIVTVTDRDGRLLRRSRIVNGREVIIIDNRPRGGRTATALAVALPALAIGALAIPRERYIVEAESAPPEYIYDALMAPPVERLPRAYTLDEIRYSPEIRNRMPRIDLDTITFNTGSWEVTPDQYDRLAPIAEGIKRAVNKNPDEVFLIEGHTDAVGNDEDNLSLSDRRAESVAVILTDHFQVPPENLTTQGYGEQQLKVPTEAAERANRRVTVRRITPLLQQGQANAAPPPPPPGRR